MSELKITISQLEDLLDRQRESIVDHIQTKCVPYKNEEGIVVYTHNVIKRACVDANYPHDFNILKRYVK